MTLLTILAHERAATIFVAVQTVTFVLVERGDGGARMSCETAPSSQQRESSSWRGSRRAHLPDLITSLLSFQELCCLRERLRLCKALQWWFSVKLVHDWEDRLRAALLTNPSGR